MQATLLAYAGLKRLNMADKLTRILDIDDMLPAVAQVSHILLELAIFVLQPRFMSYLEGAAPCHLETRSNSYGLSMSGVFWGEFSQLSNSYRLGFKPKLKCMH